MPSSCLGFLTSSPSLAHLVMAEGERAPSSLRRRQRQSATALAAAWNRWAGGEPWRCRTQHPAWSRVSSCSLLGAVSSGVWDISNDGDKPVPVCDYSSQ